MKTSHRLLILMIAAAMTVTEASAQGFLKKLKSKAESKIRQATEKVVDKTVGRTVGDAVKNGKTTSRKQGTVARTGAASGSATRGTEFNPGKKSVTVRLCDGLGPRPVPGYGMSSEASPLPPTSDNIEKRQAWLASLKPTDTFTNERLIKEIDLMGSVAMTDEVYARLDGAEGELRNRVNAIDNVVKKYKQMLDEKSSLGSDPEERLWDDYYEEQFAEALGSMSFKVAMRSPIKPLYSYLEEDTRKFLDATDLSTHTFNVTVYNGGTAEAREVQDGSLWFKVNPDSRTATVTHCDIAASAATVEIPATITYAHRTFTVTEIGNIAFYNRKIASVKLPERLKKICNAAFADTDISALEFPASLTELDEGALCGMPRLKSITIPGTVKNIPHLLLANNKSLTTAVLPQNVNEMGKGVFIDCTALTSVTLPQNITALPESTFENCKSLTRLDIPDSVTKYEQLCFYGCTALKSLPMGENVTQLEWRAFAGCTGLTAITVPARVNFGMLVFENCRNLRAATIGSQYKEPQKMNELTNIFSNCPVMPVKAGLHSGNIKFHDK